MSLVPKTLNPNARKPAALEWQWFYGQPFTAEVHCARNLTACVVQCGFFSRVNHAPPIIVPVEIVDAAAGKISVSPQLNVTAGKWDFTIAVLGGDGAEISYRGTAIVELIQ